jgi:hypothetical protein
VRGAVEEVTEEGADELIDTSRKSLAFTACGVGQLRYKGFGRSLAHP